MKLVQILRTDCQSRSFGAMIVLFQLVVCSIVLTHQAKAVTPTADLWAKGFGGILGSDYATAVATDPSGNVYLGGTIYSTSITIGATTLGSAGGQDIVIVKLDPTGAILWATSAGGTGNEYLKGIATDNAGNVYIVGSYNSSPCYFGNLSISQAGSGDMFLAKYGPAGNPIWVKGVGGTSYESANGVAVDQSGNVIVTGAFSSASVTFGSTTLNNTGNTDIFTVKYDPSGNVLWARSASGSGPDVANSVTTDQSRNVIIAGQFSSSSLTFGAQTVNTNGGYDVFVTKYDSAGNVLWAKSGGGTNQDFGLGVTADAEGNIYVGGYLSSATATFGSTTLMNPTSGYYSAFLVKYDPTGTVIWGRNGNGGPISGSVGECVTADQAGNVYLGGFFTGQLSFGTTSVNDVGGANMFFVKFNPNGNVLTIRGTGGSNVDEVNALTTDPSGNVYVAGYGNSPSINFGSTIIYPGSNSSILIAKFPGDPSLELKNVKDVPNDQGGNVYVLWNASVYDIAGNNDIASYSIYRGVSPEQARMSPVNYTKEKHPEPTVNSVSDTTYWQWVNDLTARKLNAYFSIAPTPSDSGPQGAFQTYFMVTANDAFGNILWQSNVDSGYSVDNLPPAMLPSITAQVITSSQIRVSWPKDVVDPDVGYYQVYRTNTNNFTPGPSNSIGITTDTVVTDNGAVAGLANYYRVVTVDIHGNRSNPSPQAVAGTQTTQEYNLLNGWNMVSVPLVVNNYGLGALYPSATSQAFSYAGSYIVNSTLANGTGYWVRFNGSQQTPISGYLLQTDTIPVQSGWNMIGSISSPVQVTNIQSNPSGLVTSNFFGYQGSYIIATSILPGQAYWVKMSSAGSLILSGSAANVANGIRIVSTQELPPPPPDESRNGLPNVFSLLQNYPNPFNPATTISYSLPVSGYVRLSVYNMLGEEVATLVNGVEDAGNKSVSFNASNLPSGIYTYRLTAGTFKEVKKMMLIK